MKILLVIFTLFYVRCFAIELYPVSTFVFKYVKNHPEHISLEELSLISVSLVQTPEGYFSSHEEETLSTPYREVRPSIQEMNQSGVHYFSKQALADILEAAHEFFEEKGIHWTYLAISDNQMTPKGRDLRPQGQQELVVEVAVPVIKSVAVKASESSDLKQPAYVQKQSDRIVDNFPLPLPDPSTGYPGAYVDPDSLNNYLYSLNRHPGKRVDLEIGPTHTPGGVTLDFVITEERPYHFYFSATNNIPKVIHQWQESVGFLHTQLTGHDDILRLNYSTDGNESFYTVFASYEAPFGQAIGKRWSVSGNYNRFISAEFGLAPNLFRGTQGIVDLEFIATLYQKNKFFLEGFGIVEYRHIHNRQHALNPSVMKNFIFPSLGLKAVELKLERKIIATVQLESTMSSLFWDVRHRLDALGRKNLSPNWALIEANLYWSFYLEPVIHRRVRRMASEVVVLGQFQNAFNLRLIPELEGVLGGVSTVRGYPQSTVAGDNLYLASVEYRFHLPQAFKPTRSGKSKLFGKELRWTPAEPKGRADWDLVFRVFYDLGRTTNNRPVKGENNFTVEGIGLGADFVLWSNLVLKYDWGTALKSAHGIDKGHHQSYFSAVLMY